MAKRFQDDQEDIEDESFQRFIELVKKPHMIEKKSMLKILF